MQTIYSVNELSERWHLTPASIRKMEQDGKLHRLPNIPGVKYSAREVLQLESVGLDAKALTAWERLLDRFGKWLADQIDNNDYLAGFVFGICLFAIPYIIGVIDIVVRG